MQAVDFDFFCLNFFQDILARGILKECVEEELTTNTLKFITRLGNIIRRNARNPSMISFIPNLFFLTLTIRPSDADELCEGRGGHLRVPRRP
jgi:hypothetical protein